MTQRQPLPKWTFAVVEYPGFVGNIEQVLKTLGGISSIEKGFAEQDLGSLELRYSPDNNFLHPIMGDIIQTSNIVIRIKRQRHKHTRETRLVVDVVGLAVKTCRFRSIADYQFFPHPQDPLMTLWKNIKAWNVSALEKTDFPPTSQTMMRTRIPPPIFSRVEWSQNYGQEPVMKLVNRHKAEKFISVTFHNENVEPPKEPPEEVTKHMEYLSKESIDKLKDLFESRPAWTRLAICNHLNAQETRDFKQLLPAVAYVISNGPWRDCWVRYGYDPRRHREAYVYQIIDFRNIIKGGGKTVSRRAVRLRGIGDSSERLGQKTHAEKSEADKEKTTKIKSHLFDGKEYNGGAQFQLVDITDSDLVKIIQKPGFIRNEYDEKEGWVNKPLYDHLRDLMKRKMAKLTGQALDSESDIDMDVDIDMDMDKSEMESTAADSSAQSTPVRAKLVRSTDLDQAVSSKVNELMKHLPTEYHFEGKPTRLSQTRDFSDDDAFDYYDEQDE